MSSKSKNVVIVVLAVALIGCILGTYYVEQRSRSARENASANQTSMNTSINSSSNKTSNTNTSNKNTNSNANTESNTNSNSTGVSSTNPTTNTNPTNTNTNNNVVSNTNTNSNKPSVGTNTNVTNIYKILASGTVNGKTIRVENRCGENITQQIDEYYSDGKYTYYFTSGMSGCIYTIVNQQEYTIKNALNQKVVSPEELEKIGYHLTKKANNTVSK